MSTVRRLRKMALRHADLGNVCFSAAEAMDNMEYMLERQERLLKALLRRTEKGQVIFEEGELEAAEADERSAGFFGKTLELVDVSDPRGRRIGADEEESE